MAQAQGPRRSVEAVRTEQPPVLDGVLDDDVWQQDRSRDGARGPVLEPRALGDTFSAPGHHALALKLAYWFPMD